MTNHEVAIVGSDGVAGTHASEIGRLGARARLVAAVEPDHGRLLGFAERWAVPRLYHTLDNMLACEKSALIDLCGPAESRPARAIACLRVGGTVLCEQPAARSLAEFDAVAAAESTGGGRFVGVFPHRFGGGARRLRRLVGDTRLGPPVTVVCHTLRYGAPEDGADPALGGIRQLDLMLSILGSWRQVVSAPVGDLGDVPPGTAGTAGTVPVGAVGAGAVRDVGCALVTFDCGAVATVLDSGRAARETNHLRVDFANATIEVGYRRDYDDGDWTVTAAPGHEEAVDAAWARGPRGVRSGYGAQLGAVLDAIEAGDAPPVRLAETRDTLELVTAIRASARTGRPVRRGEIGPESPFYHRLDGRPGPGATVSAAKTPTIPTARSRAHSEA